MHLLQVLQTMTCEHVWQRFFDAGKNNYRVRSTFIFNTCICLLSAIAILAIMTMT